AVPRHLTLVQRRDALYRVVAVAFSARRRPRRSTLFPYATLFRSALEAALDGRTVEYAYQSAERVEHIEGADAGEAKTTLTEWVHDRFGNPVEEYRWGEIVGSDYLVGRDEAVTLRTYANNESDWLLGYLASEELQDGEGVRVAMSRQYYDGPAFQGLPLGQVQRGNLSRTESWIEADRFAAEEASEFDEHGN